MARLARSASTRCTGISHWTSTTVWRVRLVVMDPAGWLMLGAIAGLVGGWASVSVVIDRLVFLSYVLAGSGEVGTRIPEDPLRVTPDPSPAIPHEPSGHPFQ